MKEPELQGIGERVRRIRKALGLQLSDVSESTGIAVSTLSFCENEKTRTFNYNHLYKIAKVFNMSVETLVDRSISVEKATKIGEVLQTLKRMDERDLDTFYRFALSHHAAEPES